MPRYSAGLRVANVIVANVIVAGVFMAVALSLGYWTQDRAEPVTIMSATIEKDDVKPGEFFRIRYVIKRHRICRVHLENVMYDGTRTRFTMPDEDFEQSPGVIGDDNFAIAVFIPNEASPGPASYRGIRSYYCNPVQKWFDWPIVLFHMVDFTIIPRE